MQVERVRITEPGRFEGQVGVIQQTNWKLMRAGRPTVKCALPDEPDERWRAHLYWFLGNEYEPLVSTPEEPQP